MTARWLIVLLALTGACHRHRRRGHRARPHTPPVAATDPHARTLAPAPEVSPDAVPIGFDLVPLDDCAGDDDATWLVVAERPLDGSPERERLNLGRRAQCRDEPAHVLRTPDGARVNALVSVRCELPEPAEFSVVPRGDGVLEVTRSGCLGGGLGCPGYAMPDDIVASVPATASAALSPSPLARRVSSPTAPAMTPPPGQGTVRVRWVRGPTLVSMRGDGDTRDALALVIEGAATRRIDFGAFGACVDDAKAGPRNAWIALRCERPAVGLAVTLVDDVLRVHRVALGDGGVAQITARVPLPAGTRLAE